MKQSMDWLSFFFQNKNQSQSTTVYHTSMIDDPMHG